MSDIHIDASFRDRLGAFSLDASLSAAAKGVTALVGPSGCGKTTLLRCLAGLHRAAHGKCIVAGEVWQNASHFTPTWRRQIGYVFQEASLFPHLSVRGNLNYGAPRDAGDKSRTIGFDEAVALLGIEGLLDRSPSRLSGGERQRVAIGRALLSAPTLMLMDEPLASLDRDARDEILRVIERVRDRLAIPLVYVSHDRREVERLADHIVLMESGRNIAAGPLRDLLVDLELPLARDQEAASIFDATVLHYDATYGLLTLGIDGGELLAPAPSAPAGERRRLRIAAGDVSLLVEPQQRSSILNALPARVLDHARKGDSDIVARLGLGQDGDGAHLLARVTRRSWDHLALVDGARVWAQVKGVSLERS